MTERRPLVMRFAAGTVKHFGLHMYSTAVPAIAEMVANAWDADASDVWIDIPFNESITPTTVITIRDNGIGMTYDECIDKYLVVGRDRRRAEQTDRSPGGRPLMAHKGLGKFAPFGIADVVGVRTVRSGRLAHFEMDYRKMVPSTAAEEEEFVKEYYPDLIEEDVPTNEPNGTAVVLKELRLKRAISQDVFHQAMARRFTCIGGDFQVHINGEVLPPYDIELDVRIPEEGLHEEDLPDHAGRIRWWVGFTKSPLLYDELRGVSVMARGKLAQNPFIFHVSKGVTGQAGIQYLTGIVEADFLDEEEDLIATDRSSVLWEHPEARILLEWGQKKLREWLEEWLERRAQVRLERMENERPQLKAILDSMERYPPRERDQLKVIVKRLATMVEDDEQLEWAVGSVEGAYQDRRFMALVQRLGEVKEAALPDIMSILQEYEVLESIRLAQVAAARIEVVKTFKTMLEERVREKPDMQDFIKKHPWLLDPMWQVLRHESAIDTIIAQELNLKPQEDEEGRLRLDFFCLADSLRVVVVEVKRPGRTASVDEWQKFERYVAVLRRYYQRLTSASDRRQVEGLFVATNLDDTAQQLAMDRQGQGLSFTDWEALLRRAEILQREYLDALAGAVPADDPRLLSIRRLVAGEPGQA